LLLPFISRSSKAPAGFAFFCTNAASVLFAQVLDKFRERGAADRLVILIGQIVMVDEILFARVSAPDGAMPSHLWPAFLQPPLRVSQGTFKVM
jgi:hypothetical protein